MELNSCLKPLAHLLKLQFLPEFFEVRKTICSGGLGPIPASRQNKVISQRLSPVNGRQGQLLTTIKLKLLTTDEVTANTAPPSIISVWGISKQKNKLLFKIFHVLIFEDLVFKLLECSQMETYQPPPSPSILLILSLSGANTTESSAMTVIHRSTWGLEHCRNLIT